MFRKDTDVWEQVPGVPAARFAARPEAEDAVISEELPDPMSIKGNLVDSDVEDIPERAPAVDDAGELLPDPSTYDIESDSDEQPGSPPDALPDPMQYDVSSDGDVRREQPQIAEDEEDLPDPMSYKFDIKSE